MKLTHQVEIKNDEAILTCVYMFDSMPWPFLDIKNTVGWLNCAVSFNTVLVVNGNNDLLIEEK